MLHDGHSLRAAWLLLSRPWRSSAACSHCIVCTANNFVTVVSTAECETAGALPTDAANGKCERWAGHKICSICIRKCLNPSLPSNPPQFNFLQKRKLPDTFFTMAMSTSAIDKAFAGKAFTSSQKPAVRARVSRSALVCKASQVIMSPTQCPLRLGFAACSQLSSRVSGVDKHC